MNYPSFINEHTTEFTLVPALTNILKKQFEFVIPIFPWKTREGNSFSNNIHNNDEFKVLAFYGRRPKIDLLGNKYIIKINNILLEASKVALAHNVPMIAGCPLVKNFWELGKDPLCIWIKINTETQIFYEIDFNDSIIQNLNSCGSTSFLYEVDILDYINENSSSFTIDKLFRVIQDIKIHTLLGHQLYGPIYKPIYFLLKSVS